MSLMMRNEGGEKAYEYHVYELIPSIEMLNLAR